MLECGIGVRDPNILWGQGFRGARASTALVESMIGEADYGTLPQGATPTYDPHSNRIGRYPTFSSLTSPVVGLLPHVVADARHRISHVCLIVGDGYMLASRQIARSKYRLA